MEYNMSKDWASDIEAMHDKFGVRKWVQENLDNPEKLQKFLKFRLDFLFEELNETADAIENGDVEEIVDGLIDLCVVAIGTLDAFEVNAHAAWDEVHSANMKKEPGVKPSRPNPLGLPDLIKPEDWRGPSHEHNHGALPLVFQEPR
jgi:NTP pyrophosphatase (non-canonical NTP hydrolase)